MGSAPIKRCLLSYSKPYRHLVMPIREILEALGLSVEVFDYPDLYQPVGSATHERIAMADGVVVLLGPSERTPAGQDVSPASWPNNECVEAAALGKRLALIVHPGTRVPPRVAEAQTPVRFDFWDANDFLQNAGKLVRQLAEFAGRVDGERRSFYYTRVSVRNEVRKRELVVKRQYEAAILEPKGTFEHALNAGLDKTAQVELFSEDPDCLQVRATLNAELHEPSVELGSQDGKEVHFFVHVKPTLNKETFGYSVHAELKNYFPLTADALRERASRSTFPKFYWVSGIACYGDVFDVYYPMEEISLAIQLPINVRVRAAHAIVYHYITQEKNHNETQRCNQQDALRMYEDQKTGDKIIELTVKQPSVMYSYALLYELQ